MPDRKCECIAKGWTMTLPDEVTRDKLRFLLLSLLTDDDLLVSELPQYGSSMARFASRGR